jgi:hypothetical protein
MITTIIHRLSWTFFLSRFLMIMSFCFCQNWMNREWQCKLLEVNFFSSHSWFFGHLFLATETNYGSIFSPSTNDRLKITTVTNWHHYSTSSRIFFVFCFICGLCHLNWYLEVCRMCMLQETWTIDLWIEWINQFFSAITFLHRSAARTENTRRIFSIYNVNLKIITIDFNTLSMCNSSSFCFHSMFAMIKNTRAEKQIGNVECEQWKPLLWTHLSLSFFFFLDLHKTQKKKLLFSVHSSSAHADNSVDCVRFQYAKLFTFKLFASLIYNSQRDFECLSKNLIV